MPRQRLFLPYINARGLHGGKYASHKLSQRGEGCGLCRLGHVAVQAQGRCVRAAWVGGGPNREGGSGFAGQKGGGSGPRCGQRGEKGRIEPESHFAY